MCSQTKTNKSTTNCSAEIERAAQVIREADRLLIGIGSGMSAAGGLNYANPELVDKWYPEWAVRGKRTILDIMGMFWPSTLTEKNAPAFWAFWARHIWHIRYEPGALQPYVDLRTIVGDKKHFIVSTNVDGQLVKAGFDTAHIFAPQGDYAMLQCQKPCCDVLYENRELVERMIDNMPSLFEIRIEDVPHCPHCGRLLVPNLRCDFSFVEAPHLVNMPAYEQFLADSSGKRLALLELGVGFNTPTIIRIPFEQVTRALPRATFIRINNTDAAIPKALDDSAIGIRNDLASILRQLNIA